MKKLIALLLVTVFLATSIMGLASCSTDHPIDKFATDLLTSGNNFALKLEGEDIPVIGDAELNISVDGDVRYILATLLTPEMYIEEDGEDYENHYVKNKDSGEWEKTRKEKKKDKAPVDFDDPSALLSLLDLTGNATILRFLNSANYEELKGEKKTYKLKDVASIEGVGDLKEVKVKIDKDSCTITVKLKLDGESTSVIRLTISSVGDMAVHVPGNNGNGNGNGNKK